jgi:hypothetical protein
MTTTRPPGRPGWIHATAILAVAAVSMIAALVAAAPPRPAARPRPEPAWAKAGYASPEEYDRAARAESHEHPCTIQMPEGVADGTYQTNTWPGGIVPFTFDASVDETNQERAIDAMAEIEAISPVRFVPRVADGSYITFRDSTSNSSSVGRQGGQQFVNIQSWSFRFIIVHELLHALGAWHEQQRPDRGTYVQINWANIDDALEFNFTIPGGATAHGPYDFDSVMHYDQCAFVICSCPACTAITVLPPNQGWQSLIGQRSHLSEGDRDVVAFLYGAAGDDHYEPNDALGAAPTIPLGRHDVRLLDDDDYHRIVVAEATTLTAIATFNDDQMAVQVSILEEDGTVLSQSSGPAGAVTAAASVTPGAYVVRVHRTEGEAAYELRLFGPANCGSPRHRASDHPEPDDRYGTAVAATTDYFVIGAPFNNNQGEGDAGTAYVYSRNSGGGANWGLVVQKEPENPNDDEEFGTAVSSDGDTIAVTAPGRDSPGNAGSARVYRRNFGGIAQWGLVKEVFASDAAVGDRMGQSVLLDGDLLFVGAALDDNQSAVDAGTVYIYGKDVGGTENWGQIALVRPIAPTGAESFGQSVAAEGDLLVVGAPGDDDGAAESGAAYIFDRNAGGADQWGFVMKLKAVTPGPGDSFGASVAIAGDVIVVGAPNDDDGATNAGTVTVFLRDAGGPGSWGAVATLGPETPASNDLFGTGVAVAGDVVYAGIPGDDDAASNAGAVERFVRDAGGPDAFGRAGRLTARDAAFADQLGSALAVSSDQLVVGAPGDDPIGVDDAGAAYAFSLADCNVNGVVDACDIATLVSADANGNGVPDECETLAPCDGDLDGDRTVGFLDLLEILSAWGPCAGCPGDIDGDGEVGFLDLLAVLSTWGPCT